MGTNASATWAKEKRGVGSAVIRERRWDAHPCFSLLSTVRLSRKPPLQCCLGNFVLGFYSATRIAETFHTASIPLGRSVADSNLLLAARFTQ